MSAQRLLVVDDEPQIVRGLKVILRDAGYEVETAGTKEEALAALSVRPPDAVVLDAKVAGQLGGTGVTVPWSALREVLAPWRERAVVRPEGSPICTVPPPSCRTLTPCRAREVGAQMAHQADGEVAVEVHPVHGHERQQMADMEGGRCRVDADIDANALFGEEPVECVAAAGGNQQSSIVYL